mgnify:CR=1 FL=1
MLLTKIKTAYALGLGNILRVLSYRVGVKTGINPVRRLQAPLSQGDFFAPYKSKPANLSPVEAWRDDMLLFSYWRFPLGETPPAWHINPLNQKAVANAEKPWWQIPDFDPEVGDIKQIWELSRFDWVLAFAQCAANGDAKALERLNLWLNDWCTNNPPYFGPNWKCGQEASIRVMHLAMAARILGQTCDANSALIELIHTHLKRIAPTIQYAIAQDNNHGTSEAAALFMGGAWLCAMGISEGKRFERMGRKWLENRVSKIVMEDGSFSQYSTTYHRVMLDTLSMAEVWRRHWQCPVFSQRFYARCYAATVWLCTMANEHNGDAPNIGANDGARLLPLTDSAYRDFRPSVQLAMALFANKNAYGEGEWNLPLQWLGVAIPTDSLVEPQSKMFDKGGFAVLAVAKAKAVLRYARFRFRPSHADVMHVDLWLAGENLLRDAGSFSYNTDAKWQEYFPSTASHNTVQFDGRNQMPRLSRFLLGDWLTTSALEPVKSADGVNTVAAAYKDAKGAYHKRSLTLTENKLRVVDDVEGFEGSAVLRWRLTPGAWQVDGQSISNGKHSLTVSANVAISRFAIVEGWESRFYLHKEPVPVLEVEVQQAGQLVTEYSWA